MVKPRRWWIAGLLSLLCPGLGHVYAGSWRTGLTIVAAPLLLLFGLATTATLAGWNLYFSTGWLSHAHTVLWFGAALHAAWAAHSAPAGAPLRRFQHPLAYVGMYVWAIVMAVALALTLRWTVLEAFHMPAGSMEPTILAGDTLFAVRIGPETDGPDPGDVVVFHPPATASSSPYVKRVVAVGGQTVSMSRGALFIDSRAVSVEPCEQPSTYSTDRQGRVTPVRCSIETLPNGVRYAIHRRRHPVAYSNSPPVEVPAGHVFLLGDSRDNSVDSRAWGTVPAEQVISYPRTIFLSTVPDGSPREDRVGLRIQ